MDNVKWDIPNKRGRQPPGYFIEYSNSKTVNIQPEIVEYDETLGKPAFDLIIATKAMIELGIVMDFNTKEITINCIKLTM